MILRIPPVRQITRLAHSPFVGYLWADWPLWSSERGDGIDLHQCWSASYD